MKKDPRHPSIAGRAVPIAIASIAWCGATAIAQSQPRYEVTPIVSNGSVQGTRTDTDLVNPWGIAAGPGGPMWIANNGTGSAEALDESGNEAAVITIPGATADAISAPTGVVYNDSAEFNVEFHDGIHPATFIFATDDGTIVAWNPEANPGTDDQTVTVIDHHAVNTHYTGVALMAKPDNRSRLFVANLADQRVEVYDGQFNPVTLPANAFTDPDIPDDYGPFNVAVLDGNRVFVAFAQVGDDGEEVAGHGRGFIDVFNAKGVLKSRLIQGGHLNAPWAMTISPSAFGDFSNALLVGDFGSGRIMAYDPDTGDFLGVMRERNGRRVVVEGLWGLAFGNGGAAGERNTLFFAAGPNDETDGVYGMIRPAAASLRVDDSFVSPFAEASESDED